MVGRQKVFSKQALPEVEILFLQNGMHPRDVVVRLFNPSSVFRIVEHHFSGAYPSGNIDLPKDCSSRPMLRGSYMVAQHQLFGSLLSEMETQELKQLVRVIKLQGLPHNFGLNEGWRRRQTDARLGHWHKLFVQSFFGNRVFVKVHFGRIVVAALLFMVASPYIIGKTDLLFRIDVFGKTTFAVAVRACVPGADTFVWF